MDLGDEAEPDGWPPIDCDMAAKVREHRWSETPLGPIGAWAPELRSALTSVLENALPTLLVWGRDLVTIYNSPLRALLGPRHPEAFACSFAWIGREMGLEVGSIIERAFTGRSTLLQDRQFVVERSARLEESRLTFSFTPLRDGEGAVLGIVGTAIDTSEIVRSRGALNESETRYRALLTASSDVVYRISPDWSQMRRLDGQDTLADTTEPVEGWMERYIHPEDQRVVRTAIDRALATKSMFELEHRLGRGDGTFAWVLSRAVPILNERGSIREWFATVKDVSGQKLAEEMLRDSEKHRSLLLQINDALRERQVEDATNDLKESRDFLRAALDTSQDMIQVLEAVRDENGRIIDFNWVLNNHTSQSRYGEVHGESLLTRNPGVVQEGIFDSFRRVTETGVSEQAERHYAHEQFDGWYYQSVVKLNDGVSITTKDISDWKMAQSEILRLQEQAAQAKIRESEERFRSFAENSTDALWIVDARTRRLEYLSPAFERIWGETRARVIDDLGHWAEMIHPEDRDRASKALPATLAGGSVQIAYRIVRPDNGQVRWIQDTGFPILDASDAISHIGGISQDVTTQFETAQRLQENERRLWTVIQGIPQLVWRAQGQGRWTWASQQWSDYTGQTQEQACDFGWLDALHPDDRERAVLDWQQSDGFSNLDINTRLFHAAEQRYRWFQMRALPVSNENGAIVEWLGTSTDVDDMHQLQERQQVLVAELQHRTRNLLGVVKSMADRTAAGAFSIDDFLPRYRERLGALSRINSLLSKLERGERVTFDEMIRNELGARGVLEKTDAERVVLEGPSGVRLRSATVQTFALAIHELATNAVKYGALADIRGRLHVRWQTRRDSSGRDRLRVEWSESGVSNMPQPGAAPQGGGYGRTLIERALPYQLQAETTYEFGADGVRCTIDLPLG